MSGGHFDYGQYKIQEIADSVEGVISRNGKKKTELNNWERDNCKENSEYAFHKKYSDEVIKEFKKGLKALRKAYIYAQRIDWLVSGDDGEESFIERLNKELEELKE
tara:strand:+ start:148 stop:465 length:318 start_codon:yes stop_codon:yes gene_type:complete